ncbi:MAG: TAXI family TRAP transporter solute-binding subunit [Alphaproteobacteria bacterium]|nr:TAXI family TRAP transporter solute-binding subunit [Alphaproteobacteria bacterium]
MASKPSLRPSPGMRCALPDRRQVLASGLAGFACAAVPGLAEAESREALTFFRIGTGPPSETLYSLGTAISAGISRPPGSSPCDEGGVCGVPGLIAVAQSREGSIPSIRDLRNNELESALVYADIAYWAYKGGGPFSDGRGVPDLRVIADLIPVSLHAVVRADSGIRSIRDLHDKVVSVGPNGSGTDRIVDVLLRANGLNMTEIHPVRLGPGPAADRLISGEIDAFFDMGAYPIDAVVELTDEIDIRLLPIDPLTMETLKPFFPFLKNGRIPIGAYRGTEEADTAKLGVHWVVRESMDAELIRAITQALWQSSTADVFNLNNPGHRFPTIGEGQPQGLIPPHPGAAAYYSEVSRTG